MSNLVDNCLQILLVEQLEPSAEPENFYTVPNTVLIKFV